MFLSNETTFLHHTGGENQTQDAYESLGPASISGIAVGLVSFLVALTAIAIWIKKVLILTHRVLGQIRTLLDLMAKGLRRVTGNELPPPLPPRQGIPRNRTDDSRLEMEDRRTDNNYNDNYNDNYYDTANNPTDDTLISQTPYTLSPAMYV